MGASEAKITLHHEILVLDANLQTALDSSQSESLVRSLVSELLRTLGMFELGPLQIYPALDLRAAGWSFIQPITTSHIAAHYFEKPGKYPHYHLDIYSCKSFDWKKVVQVLHKHCKLRDWRGNFIKRTMRGDKREVWEIAGVSNDVTEIKLIHPQFERIEYKGIKNIAADASTHHSNASLSRPA